MKKKLLLCFIGMAFLVGCSALIPSMSPPVWIHGTWSDEFGLTNYTFTETTMLQTNLYITLDMAEFFRDLDVFPDERITNTVYSFTVPDEMGGYTMEFSKVDTNTIDLTMKMSGATIGPTRLYRQ